MDGAYDLSMDTDAGDDNQISKLALFKVLDQHLLNKIAHNKVTAPQTVSASSSSTILTATAATSSSKKAISRRRG